MKFGLFPVLDCEGGYLAHSVMAGSKRVRKGEKLTKAVIAQLLQADVETVTAAVLEDGDLHEDIAAALVADRVAGAHVTCSGAFTGRVNITADYDGIVEIDADKINALNGIDEAVTLATLSNHSMVTKGQLLATAKIIPLAVGAKALKILGAADIAGAVKVRPYKGKNVHLLHTQLPSVSEAAYKKTAHILGQRIRDYGATMNGQGYCAHEVSVLADELQKAISSCDILLIMGASAITDRRDVIPAAIEQAGGYIIHYGMPVDPGNLLLVAKVGAKWVLGLPGCARSPKLNGVDHVLARLCAGMNVRSSDIMGMGVGGLLNEYVGRPQPRAGKFSHSATSPKIAIAILAAGRSSRMGDENKLLLDYGGRTVLDHILTEAVATEGEAVFVVTGHDRAAVEAIADNHKIKHVHNEDYDAGMSGSVKKAIANVPEDCDAVLLVLADMPKLTASVLRKIISCYNPEEGRNLVVPVHGGKRGNPVLWGREYFASFDRLQGDRGAKSLIGEFEQDIHEIDVGSDAIFLDIDTAEAYQAFIKR